MQLITHFNSHRILFHYVFLDVNYVRFWTLRYADFSKFVTWNDVGLCKRNLAHLKMKNLKNQDAV